MNKIQQKHQEMIKFELNLNPNQSLTDLYKSLRKREKELFCCRETLVRNLAFMEYDGYLITKRIDNKIYVEVV